MFQTQRKFANNEVGTHFFFFFLCKCNFCAGVDTVKTLYSLIARHSVTEKSAILEDRYRAKSKPHEA